MIRHEVGHCLGFMHNMGASYTYSVDSLRSPEFTQKWGTTPSIMDYARFNYIAQPGDYERGVSMNPPTFGPNDRFTFQWSYKPIFDVQSPEAEAKITSQMITDAVASNPVFRYGKQQMEGIVDPRAQSEDLGNDAVKASRYGVANLKYIAENMHLWVTENHENFTKSYEYYNTLLRQYILYVGHVAGNIGGVYMNEVKAADTLPRFAQIEKEKQRDALAYLFEMYNDLDWIDNAPIRKNLPLLGSVKRYAQVMVFSYMMNTLPMVSSYQDYGDDPFTFFDEMDMIYDFVWNAPSNGPLKEDRKKLQSDYITYMLKLGGFRQGGKLGTRIAFAEEERLAEQFFSQAPDLHCSVDGCDHSNHSNAPISGFEWFPDNRYLVSNISQADIYTYLSKLRDHLSRMRYFARGADRVHYRLLFETLNSSID